MPKQQQQKTQQTTQRPRPKPVPIFRRLRQGRFYRPEREPRYQVVYTDPDGDELVFGTTDKADGGMPLACAKLLSWVKNPALIDTQALVMRATA